MNSKIEVTEYTRIENWPNKIVARKLSRNFGEDKWLVTCFVGFVYVRDDSSNNWILARLAYNLEDYTVSKNRALELLDTVDLFELTESEDDETQ